MPLRTEVGRGPGDFVLHGDPASSPKKGHSPQFSACVYCGQTAGWIKMPLSTEVGLGPGDIVLDGESALPKGAHPQFSADIYCSQTAGCIVIAYHQLLPPLKGHSPIIIIIKCIYKVHFRGCHKCPSPQLSAGWTKMSLDMAVGLGPDDFVLDGDHRPPPKKGGTAPPPNFRPLHIGPALSSPVFSTLAVWCRIFQSRNFRPCLFDRRANFLSRLGG